MELLNSRSSKTLLNQYIKRAINENQVELEFIYGINNYTNKIERLQFISLLNNLKQEYVSLYEQNTLDIIVNDYRCSINGIENIKKYCKTDSIEDIPSARFIIKRNYQDEKFPSVKFKPIIDYDYNFRINFKKEEDIEHSSTEIQSLLHNWKDLLKYFRYKKRYSFITEDNLFRIDLTVVKENDYDYNRKKKNLYKSFLESNILKNNENYELEIEYIGSLSINGEFPIDKFREKINIEKDKLEKELQNKFMDMKTNYEDKLKEGDNSFSEMTHIDIAPYEDPYYFPIKGINEEDEFADVEIYPAEKKIVTEKSSFEDIKYEYWEESNRLWLFEAILTYDKKIHFVSKKINTEGDYENSPKNTNYVEYSIYPEFTEEEIELIEDYDKNFDNKILVPEDQIIRIAIFKKEISWAPDKKKTSNLEPKELEPTTPREKPPWFEGQDPRELTREWKPEGYIYDKNVPLVTFEELKEMGEFDEDIRIQQHAFEYKNKNKKPDNSNDLLEDLSKTFKKHIENILKIKENTDFILKRSDKERIILEYRSLTEQNDTNIISKKKNELKRIKENEDKKKLEKEIEKLEIKYTKFIGPNPVSMSRDNIIPDSNHSIVEGYVVTEKADGIRGQLLIGSDRLGYIITQKKEIIGTNIRFNNCPGNWLFDGEYITQDRNKNSIKLFMIFDVYYASDGHSKYPEHAYTYPWINRKKKDISRSLILSEFQETVELVLDNTDFRIGYKSYLEGPKKMQISKKDPNKYSNVGGIFKQSKKLWDIETKKSGYTYSIDGLIYMPMYLSVGSMEEGISKKSFGGEWSINYKWKPPEENTIDFKVRIVQEKNKGKDRDKITSSKINGKIVKCKQLLLYVGYDIKKDDNFDYNWELLNETKSKPIKEILFNPEKDNKSFYFCNIPLKNNKMFCEKDKSEILNGQIIEMKYSPENSQDMLWTPLRVRTDKENPQFFITANKIWSTIINPVTTDLITGIEDIYEVKEKIIEENKVSKYQYYVEEGLKEDDYSSDTPLRKLHNFIKNNLITAICSIGNSPISIMDTSIGRGGDIKKYLYSKNRIKFLLGLDISPDVNRAAKRFYLENRQKPKAMFIQYDTSESIKDGYGYKGSDEEIERNKYLLNIIFNKNKKVPKSFENIEKKYHKIAENGFNIISSQFTIHYYFKNEMTLRGYLQNLSDNCKVGGYFIGTCYDGNKVFDLLKDKDSFEMEDEYSNKVFSIKKKYDIESFEYEKNNVKPMFGQEIEVEMSSIGNPFIEYLVNFDMFIDYMKLYRFKLVSPELKGIYSGIFNKEQFSLRDGLGNFEQIIDKLPQLGEKNKILKTIYSQANEINLDKNSKLKQLSSLNNWFIFEKY